MASTRELMMGRIVLTLKTPHPNLSITLQDFNEIVQKIIN
jgi:hypothetical protein